MPKASVKIDGEFLLYSGRQGTKGSFKGVIVRSQIASVHVFDTHSSEHPLWHVHVFTAASETHKATTRLTVTKATADAVLNWFYQKPFPPPEIIDIEDTAAYEAALHSFVEESK